MCGACAGGSTPSSPSSTSGSGSTAGTGATTGVTTITVTASGVSPKNIAVPLGTVVTFVNNDNQPHDISSDPHPQHTDCPDINNVGFLSAGQSRQTGALRTARTCGFHDHNQPSNNALQGTITVQ
jgi:plastocyanin